MGMAITRTGTSEVPCGPEDFQKTQIRQGRKLDLTPVEISATSEK